MISSEASPAGHLPAGWRIVALRDVTTKIGSGATPRGGESAYLSSRLKYVLVRSQNVHDRWLDSSSLAFISDKDAESLAGVSLQPGDVLLNITGDGATFGRSCIVPEEILPACVNQHVAVIRPRSEVCLPGYLLAYLTSASTKGYVDSFNSGGSRRAITKGHIESFLVPLPPISEQQAISRLLGALDEKIRLNRRISQTLDAMARAIFKSWFVDFDWDEAGQYTSVASSRPGNIPAGWSVSTLGEHVEVARGLSYKGSGLSGEGVPLHNLNSIYEGGGYKHDGIKHYQGSFRERYLVNPGDLIVANTEQGHDRLLIGFPAIIPEIFGATGLFSHHLYRLRVLPDSPVTSLFLYFLLLERGFHEQVVSYASGTTVNMLPLSALQKPRFALPPKEMIGRFDAIVSPLVCKIEQSFEESRSVASLRDLLLPRLVSGKLRLRQ